MQSAEQTKSQSWLHFQVLKYKTGSGLGLWSGYGVRTSNFGFQYSRDKILNPTCLAICFLSFCIVFFFIIIIDLVKKTDSFCISGGRRCFMMLRKIMISDTLCVYVHIEIKTYKGTSIFVVVELDLLMQEWWKYMGTYTVMPPAKVGTPEGRKFLSCALQVSHWDIWHLFLVGLLGGNKYL